MGIQNKYLFWFTFQHWHNWLAKAWQNYEYFLTLVGGKCFLHTTKKCKGKQYGESRGPNKTQTHTRNSIMLQATNTNFFGCWWIQGYPFNVSPVTSECTLSVSMGSGINQHILSLPTSLPLGILWGFPMFSESPLKPLHIPVSLLLSLYKKLPSPKLQNFWNIT